MADSSLPKSTLAIKHRIDLCITRLQLNILLNFTILALGSIAGNLIITGYFLYGVPLTVVGLVLAYIVFRRDQKEQSFNQKLVDRQLY